jgi:hypothetical protein
MERRCARRSRIVAVMAFIVAVTAGACASSTPGSASVPASRVPVASGPGTPAASRGTAAPVESPSASGAPSAAVAPTLAVTPLPSAVVPAEETPVMGGPGGGATNASPEASLGRDEELEARLPHTLDGTPVHVESTLGVDVSADADPSLGAFLAALGRSPEDLSIATGWSEDGTWEGQIGAMRVRGAQADRILRAFVDAAGSSSEKGLTVTNEVVGGREAVKIVNRDSPEQGPMYVVATGDAVYFVQSTTTRIVNEALAAFPR